jgi:hypothetical protein
VKLEHLIQPHVLLQHDRRVALEALASVFWPEEAPTLRLLWECVASRTNHAALLFEVSAVLRNVLVDVPQRNAHLPKLRELVSGWPLLVSSVDVLIQRHDRAVAAGTLPATPFPPPPPPPPADPSLPEGWRIRNYGHDRVWWAESSGANAAGVSCEDEEVRIEWYGRPCETAEGGVYVEIPTTILRALLAKLDEVSDAP